MVSLISPKKLFEDDDLLVILKPVDWVVNRAESVKVGTIQDWVEKNTEIHFNLQTVFGRRSGIVHRLDKVTSGVLIIAKTKMAFEDLQRQFKQRLVQKEYRALAHGLVLPAEGMIQLPIGRKPANRQEFGVVLGGRPAETSYSVLGYYLSPSKKPVTLVSLRPKSGRTHQLRVHLKHLGYPLVGDPVYGGRKNIREDRDWCPRLFLHAYKVCFNHPQKGDLVCVRSDLPASLRMVLARLTEK